MATLLKEVLSNVFSNIGKHHESSLTLKDVCGELGEIQHLWFTFGVQLGIPRNKLKEFERESDPLSAVIDYWLRGNVECAPISWEHIAKALGSSHVGETGLARRIRIKHCEKEGDQARKGTTAC
jgi:hypothetical protein